jgi:hypothetical protein
LSVYL